MPDPYACREFKFNHFRLYWDVGMLPHMEPLLYVVIGGEKFIVGRFIESCQVKTCWRMFHSTFVVLKTATTKAILDICLEFEEPTFKNIKQIFQSYE